MWYQPESIIGTLIFNGRKVHLRTDSDSLYYVQTRSLKWSYLTGDTVRARIAKGSIGGKLKEVQIEKLLRRTNETLIGSFVEENGEFLFEIHRWQGIYQKKFVSIPKEYALGDILTCKFDNQGRLIILQKFAKNNDFDKEEKILFAIAHTRTHFSPEVQNEARNLQCTIPEGRRDFRDWYTLTIDGTDAKDLDDALSIKKLANGHMLLGVHIADVSEYVREGSLLDREARQRATSIYTPGKVVPMLPERLSNDLSSLHPGAPKLTLSILMEIDASGQVRDREIVEGIIESRKKGVYESIETSYRTKSYDSVDEETTLELLYILHEILTERRKKEGKILFESTEVYFQFDDNVWEQVRIPSGVKKRQRLDAHMLIEECMILANEEVAKWCTKKSIPFLSRVHGLPSADQMRMIEYIIGKVSTKHIETKKPSIEPLHIRNFMDKLWNEDIYRYSRLLLPKMAKAVYSDKKFRHFGLALEYYAHFTSPIRRYPDLQIHRIIKEELHGLLTPERKKHYAQVLKKMAHHCSEMERHAEDLERQFDALYACRYMMGFVGHEFEGMVSGIANFAYFVELSNGIECSIELPYKQYTVDEALGVLKAKNGKTVLSIGQKIHVCIEKVDMIEKRIIGKSIGASFWQF